MILHSLLKTGQYFSKDNVKYNNYKVREYDKHEAEQLFNEWLKKKDGIEDREGSDVNTEIENKGRREDEFRTEVIDGPEVKQEPDELSSELGRDSIALERDKDINDQIDLHIALFESNEILRKNLGVEESISLLNNYFASKNVTTVDKSEQVTEATKYILDAHTTVSTGRPHLLLPDHFNNAEVGSINVGFKSGHLSKDFAIGLPGAISAETVKERTSLQNSNADKNINISSECKEAYTHICNPYINDNKSACTCKLSVNCAGNIVFVNQAHSQETTRKHEERPSKYRKTDLTPGSQYQNYDNTVHSQGIIELPHQQQYKLYLSRDTEPDSIDITSCDTDEISYQIQSNQSVITNTNIPNPGTSLDKPIVPLKLPKLLPLVDYEDSEGDEEKEKDNEEALQGPMYDHIPDIRALAEYAVLRMPGSRKRSRSRKWRYIKNWEFLMRLLADPRSNPRLIRWEEREQYIFRLTQGDIITDIWNSKSEKPPITYNNFARGLRYHYKTGILIPVHDRQLTYGCGPEAVKFLQKLLKNQEETAESNSRFFRPWD